MSKLVGFIGTGSMGRTLVEALIRSGALRPSEILLSNRTRSKAEALAESHPGIRIAESNAELVREADWVFLCIKPRDYREVLDEIGGMGRKRTNDHFHYQSGDDPRSGSGPALQNRQDHPEHHPRGAGRNLPFHPRQPADPPGSGGIAPSPFGDRNASGNRRAPLPGGLGPGQLRSGISGPLPGAAGSRRGRSDRPSPGDGHSAGHPDGPGNRPDADRRRIYPGKPAGAGGRSRRYHPGRTRSAGAGTESGADPVVPPHPRQICGGCR